MNEQEKKEKDKGQWYPQVTNFNKGEFLGNNKDNDILQKRMDIDLRK